MDLNFLAGTQLEVRAETKNTARSRAKVESRSDHLGYDGDICAKDVQVYPVSWDPVVENPSLSIYTPQ